MLLQCIWIKLRGGFSQCYNVDQAVYLVDPFLNCLFHKKPEENQRISNIQHQHDQDTLPSCITYMHTVWLYSAHHHHRRCHHIIIVIVIVIIIVIIVHHLWTQVALLCPIL